MKISTAILLASASALLKVGAEPSAWSTYLDSRSTMTVLAESPPPLEVSPLIVSGDPKNRIDIVFFSDGYLSSEKPKFLSDAMAFAKDITTNNTFHSVQPLMNFWAAFTPSKESGVGRGGQPLDTVFQLYRDGTELRGVWSNDYEKGRVACSSLGAQCDYPVLAGNDPLYGGSGGIPTIITASPLNGHQILRHELGHSILGVGEEYDGQPYNGYFGINAAKTNANPIPWAHWLTDPASEPRTQRSVMPYQNYAWALMNMTTPWQATFVSSGTFTRHLLRFSLSGLPAKTDMKLELDGVDLNWEPKPDVGMDRWFYDMYRDMPLEAGKHQVKFTLKNMELEGDAQMCSLEVLEFGNADEFIAKLGYVGAFPTYSMPENRTTYRPTNEDCLMRQVTTSTYCPVCLEGLWTTLLGRLSLIDNVTETCEPQTSSTILNATLIPVAQFRSGTKIPGESYTIQWLKNGKVVAGFTNQTVVKIPKADASGNYTLDVKFSSAEIRLDRNRVTEGQLVHTITGACNEK
ncbi:hypothetical protein E1B28_012737 [Marasmius oreades]|uniref:IgA peptidase M64 n=1 Tax=Marasmius oreades TaxID=181124 RepID=A0A9P7UQ90_9AGAR|nr:uncharacterized protein E1B28_012737 [Marasmius oreades]KAG7088771.1 hypothetical protein E1B28_012737 [Marasmius oreades]